MVERMTKKVLISFDDIINLRAQTFAENFPDFIERREPTNAPYGVVLFEAALREWFDAQPDTSNLEKIILAYEQATDISPEELNIRDEE